MTIAEWKRMPMLLHRKTVLAVTGLRSSDLSQLVESGQIKPRYLSPRTYKHRGKKITARTPRALYLKADVAKLVGLEI